MFSPEKEGNASDSFADVIIPCAPESKSPGYISSGFNPSPYNCVHVRGNCICYCNRVLTSNLRILSGPGFYTCVSSPHLIEGVFITSNLLILEHSCTRRLFSCDCGWDSSELTGNTEYQYSANSEQEPLIRSSQPSPHLPAHTEASNR